jgi:hypothetical protein
MRIQTNTLENVRKNTRLRRDLARVLDTSEQAISRHIKNNRDNGELTKYAAVKTIAFALNIPDALAVE